MRYLSLLILSLALLVTVSPGAAQSDNLLHNPGFEEQFFTQISADPNAASITYNAPYWWWGGVIVGGAQPWINAHPSGYPHSAGYKHSGGFSFEMGRGGATYTAYLYQQVFNIPAGTQVRGGAWYYQNSGQGFVRVGIATDGNTFPDAPSVVWSDWQTTLHSWQEISVEATATGEAVTLFLFATQPNPSDPNFTYWDDAFVNVTGSLPMPPAAPGAPSAPAAPSGVTFTVNTDLRIRSGPGTDYPIVGRIPDGGVAEVVGRTSFNWLQVNYQGVSGWIAGNLGTLSVTLDQVPVTWQPS